jgi:SSS family solute:Na+ symporter
VAANVIVFVAWIVFPATHVTPHVIFNSWIACLLAFFITAAIDRRKIRVGPG